MSKQKLKDRPIFGWLKNKFPELAGKGLEVLGDLTGRESLEGLGKLIQGKEDMSPEDLQMFSAKMDFEYKCLELEVKDRDSARNREIEIAKANKKDYMMKATGIIGLGLLVFVVISIVYKPSLQENKLLIHLLGIIEGVALSIFNYYFGSSKGSKDKTRLLGEK
jgi:hypothetical protein